MTPRHAPPVALIVLLLQQGSVHAHHAFSPVYDGSRTVTIMGTLTDFKLVNPHAMMTIDVVDKTGNHVVWTVEMAGLLSLTRQGGRRNGVVGERLTVSGNPTHTGSARESPSSESSGQTARSCWIHASNSASTVEEQRRERARQRQEK